MLENKLKYDKNNQKLILLKTVNQYKIKNLHSLNENDKI